MAKYSCINCTNLKTRVVMTEDIGRLTRGDVDGAIRKNDIESLKLKFPLNFTLYKRLRRHKECTIVYCAERMLNRSLYIYRNNIEKTVSMASPCPRYK